MLHAGLVITAVGMAWLAWTIGARGRLAERLGPGPDDAGRPASASGLIFAPLFDIILSDLDDREVGTGSGVLNAVQQFGGALGVAVLGTLFFQWIPEDGWYDATRAVIWVDDRVLRRWRSLPSSCCPSSAREDVLG